MTAERFVWREFAAVGRQRLYRTGDRVRWTADGELEFLGRLDQQIKLRGYRIELEEIEHHLRSQPGVATAVVGLENTDRGLELVAYIQLENGAKASRAEAAVQSMRDTLPAHMIPTDVRLVDLMPLTPNGKLDRRALNSIPVRSSIKLRASSFVAPSGEIESTLARIWRDVLGVTEPISADASFFEVGGNSLLATRVLSRLRPAFAVSLTLEDLFQASSIQKLAAKLAK